MKIEKLQKWRCILLLTMFIGYSSYYVSRKTFPYVMPLLLTGKSNSESGITLNKKEFGFITSAFFVSYASSKLFAGYLSDRFGAKILFSSGLAASGLLNICIMLFARSRFVLCILWFANGFVQGFGWPPCAQLIYSWFEPTKAGTVWSILTVACTLTPTVLPILFTYMITSFNWPSCFLFAGLWSISISILVLPFIHNQPSDINLKNVKNNSDSMKKPTNSNLGIIEALTVVSKHHPLLYVSISYLIASFAKNGLENWIQLFVIEKFKGSSQQASFSVSMFQLGGTVGCVMAGFVSDRLMQFYQTQDSKLLNPRLPVLFVFTVLMLFSYIGCHLAPTVGFLYLSSAAAGFASYGPQALYGLLAIEVAKPGLGLLGTSQAFAVIAAQVGVFTAGYPLSIVLSYLGWTYHFICIEVAVFINAMIIIRTCFIRNGSHDKID